MRGNSKKLLIFEVLIIVMLFLNNFVSSILKGYIEVIFLLVLLIAFYFIFGFTRDRHHLWRNTCLDIIIFLLIFFALYYASGIIMSFARVRNYYNISSLINIILPMILIIILRELLRYFILVKTNGYKILFVITCILFILIDLIGKYNLTSSSEKYDIFIFLAIVLLPIISKNILATFLSYKVGYKPVILYMLATELYGYLIPIIPNPNQYLYSIIWLVMPIILLYRLHIYFNKEKHDIKLEREKNKKKVVGLVIPIIIIITLIYFVSGYFHYYAIVIASGSMENEISKGDIVVVEKINGNTDLLELNQVIAYKYKNKIVVHRLVKTIVVDNEIIYYTKGDANNKIDNYKITKDMIIGVVNLKIPYIGYPTVWINEL